MAIDMDEQSDGKSLAAAPKTQRRRNLLPWWVLAFIWIFLVFFALMPVGIVLGLLKIHFQLALLGLSTDNPLSVTGLAIIALFCIKGVTALALWTEKTWAVKLAKIDAIISIVICCLMMLAPLFAIGSTIFSFRLELIAIVPYYYKMQKIQYDWEYFGDEDPLMSFNIGESSQV